MRTFLFYDLETSGLNKSFDQILQFAGVRTDAKLKEIERHSFYVKLRPDVIPSPYASITHRIKIKETMDGICEYEAAKRIHALFNTPGTISLGYNTLGFDDEFLRFTFYRNLLTPYTHQFKNDCIRMDLFPITLMFYLYKNNVLKWPVPENKVSLKLENINNENSLFSGQAHDATVDVDVTIKLTEKLMAEKEMWNYLLGFFDKDQDHTRTHKMPELFQSETGIHRIAIAFSASFGAEQNFQAPVLLIGNSIPYKNQFLWLRLDFPELRESKKENAFENCYVIRKKLGEPEFLLPPKDRFIKMISPERITEMNKNIEFLKKNKDIFGEICRHFRNFRYEKIPNLDVDASLYQDGFMDDDERDLCENFHKLPERGKLNAVKSFRTNQNKELARRILYRNFNITKGFSVDEYLKKVYPEDGSSPMIDFTGKERNTTGKTIEEIGLIRKNEELDEEQISILDELEEHLKRSDK